MRRWLRARPPVHAFLSHFPTAFLIGGTAFDAGGLALARPLWWIAGAHLIYAGVATGAIAALAGFADHLALPAGSPERRRSATHAALNLTALALFALARWVRGHPEIPPDPPIIAAEALAAVLVLIATVLGSRLVFGDRVVARESEG